MYCRNCGGKISEGGKFCVSCGAETGGDPGPASRKSQKSESNEPALASSGRRLANYFIDRVASLIFISILLQVNLVLGVAAIVGYFIFFEGLWQRTPGKWITKTKVVNREGKSPTFGQIVGRSFARFIPFEPFSFLFGNPPRGWHDSLSGTYVVSADVTEEDFKKIDLEARNNSGTNVAIIIVAIVVGVAVIGILASVVLASLNTARSKGSDAKIKAQLSGARAAAEIYYDDNSSYGSSTNSCLQGMFIDHASGMAQYTNTANYPEGTVLGCFSDGDQYIMAATLSNDGGFWCVDGSGASMLVPEGYQVRESCQDMYRD